MAMRPAGAMGGGPGVRLVLCRAACLPLPLSDPPLTAPQGSASTARRELG